MVHGIEVCYFQGNENSMSIWDRICKHKKPVIEPRESSSFPLSIKVTPLCYMVKTHSSIISIWMHHILRWTWPDLFASLYRTTWPSWMTPQPLEQFFSPFVVGRYDLIMNVEKHPSDMFSPLLWYTSTVRRSVHVLL